MPLIDIQTGDALAIPVDVLAVKSGTELYGVTNLVVDRLEEHGIVTRANITASNKPMLVNTGGRLGARQVLFQPAPPLTRFDYAEIREFGGNVLRTLSSLNTRVQTLALTLHGIGYGLDEGESIRAEVAGVVDAVEADMCPPDLKSVVIVDAAADRVERLRAVLFRALPSGYAGTKTANEPSHRPSAAESDLRAAGHGSRNKPYVFVAMPFSDDYLDVFEYGIQNAVRKAADDTVLCERADLSSFTGDVLDYVRTRIEGASLVIADLTTANANVYLEIGYAWGCHRSTVLLVNSKSREQDVKFDLRGQRFIEYKSIKDLETRLEAELRGLAVFGGPK